MHVNMHKIAPAVVVLLLGAGFLGYLSTRNTDTPTVTDQSVPQQSQEELEQPPQATISDEGTIVSYGGQDNRTALEILKELTDAGTENSSFGEYVTSINGVMSDNGKFWLFYINGESATIGAGEYVTRNSDTIEWRLE